jgi:hypothetical protein
MIRPAHNNHFTQTGRYQARVGLQYARNAAMRLKSPARLNEIRGGCLVMTSLELDKNQDDEEIMQFSLQHKVNEVSEAKDS